VSNSEAKPKVIAIIPARAGSKGIPSKNIMALSGKPLIHWTIDHAKNSGVVDYIHVSTDSAEIASVAKNGGAKCEFLRPSDISGDRVGTAQAITHSLQQLQNRGLYFDIVLELQPTYCLRGYMLVKDCVEVLSTGDFSSLITCQRIETTKHPDYVITTSSDGLAKFGKILPDNFARQNLRPSYSCHGLVLAAKVTPFLSSGSFYTKNCYLFDVQDSNRFKDIDNVDDYYGVVDFLKREPEYLI